MKQPCGMSSSAVALSSLTLGGAMTVLTNIRNLGHFKWDHPPAHLKLVHQLSLTYFALIFFF